MTDWYKKLIWSWAGGRPLTYQLRDLWHKAEIVWILGLVAVGVVLGHNFDWGWVLGLMGVFTLGFIFGHLFWGREYIAGQRGSAMAPD
ncbi:hypothetical protein LCGC14_1751880 [marine sediment metagenome]|uniref:Uncharacterized protein n=1 Tax=marine sediment metagenome TaxID=412755 RepID=A0A0F9H3J8_9ZZZZ